LDSDLNWEETYLVPSVYEDKYFQSICYVPGSTAAEDRIALIQYLDSGILNYKIYFVDMEFSSPPTAIDLGEEVKIYDLFYDNNLEWYYVLDGGDIIRIYDTSWNQIAVCDLSGLSCFRSSYRLEKITSGDLNGSLILLDFINVELVIISLDSEFPEPDIKANGQDGPITITRADVLSITTTLDKGICEGAQADWWLTANTPFGWYYYHLTKGWLPGKHVTHQGSVRDIPSLEVLNRSGLPAGTYTFYFGVDLVKNGIIDMDKAFYDMVKVTINP
jgi:hypothetical protein